MASKGVDLYGYKVNENQQLALTIQAPESENTYTVSSTNQISTYHIDVKLRPFYIKGDYTFDIGAFTCSCKINLYTGNISDSCMDNMLSNQQCVTYSEGIISYGFYDAGFGYDNQSYTSSHQNYVYIGDCHRADWMANLVENYTDISSKPFSVFVLPGAHDAGMNTHEKISEVAMNAKCINQVMLLLATWRTEIYDLTLEPILRILKGLSTSVIERGLVNLVVSQKDSITNMLNMGTRYFDFRPGYITKIEGRAIATGAGLYHQHNFLPGMAFSDFLNQIIDWMEIHTGEIVVINLNFSEFYNNQMKPTPEVLEKEINNAIGNKEIVTGDIQDVKLSYSKLIAAKKRLLFFNDGAAINGIKDAHKYDSYSSSAYTSLKPEPILDALNGMQFTPPDDKQYTVLQLQGYASKVKSLWPKVSSLTSNNSSPLLMTKAYFDSETYPWASSKLSSFNRAFPLVILNNFVDPAMSHIAQTATLARSENI